MLPYIWSNKTRYINFSWLFFSECRSRQNLTGTFCVPQCMKLFGLINFYQAMRFKFKKFYLVLSRDFSAFSKIFSDSFWNSFDWYSMKFIFMLLFLFVCMSVFYMLIGFCYIPLAFLLHFWDMKNYEAKVNDYKQNECLEILKKPPELSLANYFHLSGQGQNIHFWLGGLFEIFPK